MFLSAIVGKRENQLLHPTQVARGKGLGGASLPCPSPHMTDKVVETALSGSQLQGLLTHTSVNRVGSTELPGWGSGTAFLSEDNNSID